jgi:transcriptional regulator with XRE-family HTH domain
MTLRDMSACTQIPVSTLSKVEHNRLTLSFDRLNTIAGRLGIHVTDLFASESTSTSPIPCRRSLERLTAVRDPAASLALFADLTHKRMTPTLIHLPTNTATPANTGELLLFILHGTIDVHTRYYTPTRLTAGDASHFSGIPVIPCVSEPRWRLPWIGRRPSLASQTR